MAELCFSVDDFALDFFSNTVADTASECDSYEHRRCWTAAASCPYYSCRRRAKPVGLVLPCVCCSRTRCCALCFVASKKVRRYVYFSGKQSGISSELLGFNHSQELATEWFDPIFSRWVLRRDQKNWPGLVTTRNVS